MARLISQLNAPALAGVVRAETAGEAVAEIRNCLTHGADMIDLHVSCLEETDDKALSSIMRSPLPVMALHYDTDREGNPLGTSEEARAALLLRCARAGAVCVDMQGYTFHLPSKHAFCGQNAYSFTIDGPKEVITDPALIEKQTAFMEEVRAAGAEVLLSCHPGVTLDRGQVVDLALFLEKRGPDLIKIVSVAKSEEDLLESFSAMRLLKKEIKTPVVYHVNGKAGRLSRIVNPVLGSHIAFCVDRYAKGHTLQMPELAAARSMIDQLQIFMK